jgi:hypothetical protein
MSILTDNTQLFIESRLYNMVYQINISDKTQNYTYHFGNNNIYFNYPTNTTPIGTFPVMGALQRNITTDYRYAYLATTTRVVQIDSVNHTVVAIALSGYNATYGIATDGINVYVNDEVNFRITKITLDTNEVTLDAFPSFDASFGSSYGMVVSNWKLYTATKTNPTTVYEYQLPLPYPCFVKGSRILTKRGYIAIEKLKPGDFIKTVCSGYKAIHQIGKKEITHPASDTRIKHQLYVCSADVFEEVFADLVITGCHSILVEEWTSEDERQRAIDANGGNVYITDNYYRLPACADLRTRVYEHPGTYTIYHIALENENYYTNYGIYANGLLVESCSQRYLKELSNMKRV